MSDLLATPAGGLGLALAVIALAPSLVVWAWCYASGVPVDVDRVTYAHGGAFGSDFATLGLFGPPHLAWTLLALVPLACYFLGGRVAARLAGARRPGGAFVAGALVALPLTLLSALLASLATLGIQATVPAGTLIVDVSPSATANLLPIFLVTALVAGFGGRGAVTRPGLGASVTVRLVKPGRARKAFFGALDRLVGRHPRARLGLPRALAYTGILAACALSLLLLALDAANLALMPRLPDGLLPALDGAAAALLVAIPLACFAAALCARLVGGLARPVGPDASLAGRTPARSSARHPVAISR